MPPVVGADGCPLYAALGHTISSTKGSADALAHKTPNKDLRSSWVPAFENPIKAKFAELPAAKLRGPFAVNGPIALVSWLFATFDSIILATIRNREVTCRP